MEQKLSPKMAIRLYYHEEKCFGPGIATLLIRVRELHSLRSAAQSMNMAYSKAWKILHQCEAVLGVRLLSSTTGGRGGGGAVLTQEGLRLLEAYETYRDAMNAYSDRIFPALFGDILLPERETPEKTE